MKTNNYTFFENLIIDNIDLSAYNLNNDVYLYDKVKTAFNIFKSEYLHQYNLKKYNYNKELIFAEYLQGLPSVCSLPFYNYDILQRAKNEGFDLDTEKKEDEFLNSYWLNCSSAFFTLYNNL